jgi:hypothetical protein
MNEAARRAMHVRVLGTIRVPVTLTACPRATLYQYPDGRLLFCLRLWDVDGATRRCVSPGTLRAYARESGLATLEREIDDLVRLARSGGGRV